MQYKTILFDLDGTLADNSEGIVNGVLYALEKLGIHEQNPQSIHRFIGPPILDSFMQFYDLPEDKANQGVQLYREIFAQVGVHQATLYDGITPMLERLKQAGYLLATASSKPEKFVRQILTDHNIVQYFDAVIGADLEGKRQTKQSVCLEALRRTQTDAADAVLVGDRMFDAEGAAACGMDCIAALYGFGTREEFEPYPIAFYAQTTQDVADFLIK